MALDFIAISSRGAYPTPTPTGARRAALAVSQGLLNITLPSPTPVSSAWRTISGFFGKLPRLFRGVRNITVEWGL